MANDMVINVPSWTPVKKNRFPRLNQLQQKRSTMSSMNFERVPVSKPTIVGGSDVRAFDNPFVCPSDLDVSEFQQRMKEKEKIDMTKMPVHSKTTKTSRRRSQIGEIRRRVLHAVREEESPTLRESCSSVYLAPGLSRNIERITDYISRNRQLFLLEYITSLNKSLIATMIKTTAYEEKKMAQDEKYIEEYRHNVEAFLSKNEKNRADAFIRAEEATKARLQKVAEIKNISIEIMKIRSAIAKDEDKLMDSILSKNILEMLTPKELKEKKIKDRIQRSIDAMGYHRKKVEKESTYTIKTGSDPSSDRKTPGTQDSLSYSGSLEEKHKDFKLGDKQSELSVSEPVPELYFENPQQVLDVFYEMEEQTLMVLQYYQELEEELDKLKGKITKAQGILSHKEECLKLEVKELNARLDKENQKIQHLMLKVKVFTAAGSIAGSDGLKLLTDLDKAIDKIYHQCCNFSPNLSSVHKLASIENEINRLMDVIETGKPEKTEKIKKQKLKDMRERQRGEILLQLKQDRDRKRAKILEETSRKARIVPSRKLMYRSKPPESKTVKKTKVPFNRSDQHTEEFFTLK